MGVKLEASHLVFSLEMLERMELWWSNLEKMREEMTSTRSD